MSEEEARMMEEVEEELNRIKNKSSRVADATRERYCNVENVESCLDHLDQVVADEFEYLDVVRSDGPRNLKTLPSTLAVLCDAINGAFDLIDLYREANREKEEISRRNRRLLSDVATLRKTVDRLGKEVAVKDKQIEVNKEKHCMERMKNGELQNRVTLAERELNVVQKENRSNADRHKHEVRRVEETNRRLENKFRRDCGNYVSRDANAAAVADRYKRNEEALKDTIAGLKLSNRSLLEEIVDLKEKLSGTDHVSCGNAE